MVENSQKAVKYLIVGKEIHSKLKRMVEILK